MTVMGLVASLGVYVRPNDVHCLRGDLGLAHPQGAVVAVIYLG